jgi:plasmid maintenance system antidote protein VapI
LPIGAQSKPGGPVARLALVAAHLNEIVLGKRGITADTALRLSLKTSRV